MNFKQVEAFRTVMMTRSMTTAAALMHTSQPNVSRWISLLERQVGFTLFSRVGTRLIPTPEAEVFHTEVERAFIGLDALEETAGTIRKHGTGLLRIGAVGSVTQCVLPAALRLFRESFPDTPVVVNTGSSDAVAKWVATGYCDIGFASLVVDIASVHHENIHTAFGVGIVHRRHRLASAEIIRPVDFANEHFLSLPAGSFNREQIDRHFRDCPRILAVETPYATTICSMVGQGLGVSIVNPVVVRAMGIADVAAVRFSEAVEFRSYAVGSDQFPRQLTAGRMLDCVRSAFARMDAVAAGSASGR